LNESSRALKDFLA